MKVRKLVADSVARLARAGSYEITPHWKLDRQPLVRHLRALFQYYRVDCVFDVGANKGQYRDLLRDDVGFDGWIFSFEPVSRYIEILNGRAGADPRWKIFDFALGSTDTEQAINVTRSPGLNSFLEQRGDMVREFWTEDSIEGTEQVRIRTLDGLFEGLRREYGFLAPYLKMDTQGFDLEVVAGARHSLPAVVGLQAEASIRPIYQGMPDYRASIKCLEEAGFDLSGMFEVSHDEGLRMIEFDCVMVNRVLADVSGGSRLA